MHNTNPNFSFLLFVVGIIIFCGVVVVLICTRADRVVANIAARTVIVGIAYAGAIGPVAIVICGNIPYKNYCSNCWCWCCYTYLQVVLLMFCVVVAALRCAGTLIVVAIVDVGGVIVAIAYTDAIALVAIVSSDLAAHTALIDLETQFHLFNLFDK